MTIQYYQQKKKHHSQSVLNPSFSNMTSAIRDVKKSHTLSWDMHQKVYQRHFVLCCPVASEGTSNRWLVAKMFLVR